VSYSQIRPCMKKLEQAAVEQMNILYVENEGVGLKFDGIRGVKI